MKKQSDKMPPDAALAMKVSVVSIVVNILLSLMKLLAGIIA